MGAVRHRFSVEEYQKMGEAGIFSEDDRVELVDGEVVDLAAIGKRHVESVMRLTHLLSRWTLLEAPDNEEGRRRVPGERTESGDSERARRAPARPRRRTQVRGLLGRARSRGSAAGRGGRRHLPRLRPEYPAPLYATVGIPEAWLVDLTTDTIEVHSEPGAEGYGKVTRSGRARKVISATLQDLTFDAAEALPPVG